MIVSCQHDFDGELSDCRYHPCQFKLTDITMKTIHIFALVLVAAIWGANFAVIKFGLLSTPPLALSTWRFVLAAVPACFFLARPDMPLWRLVAIGMSLGTLMSTFQFVGMQQGVTASASSVLLQSQAFMTICLASLFLSENTTARTWVALVLGGGGLLCFIVEHWGNATAFGMLMVCVAAFWWAVSNILMRGAKSVDPIALIAWISLIPIIPLGLFSMIFERNESGAALFQLSSAGVLSALFLAYGVMIFGYGLWGFMLQRYTAPNVAPFSLLVPVFGIIFGVMIFGDNFTLIEVIGTTLLVISLAVNVLPYKQIKSALFPHKSRV